jgi:general stress protein YciG
MGDPRTYVKLHGGFFRNRKARAVGKDGRELYLAGLCYAGDALTDGIIPKNILALVALEAEVKPTTAKKLVDNGMWIDEGDHYRIHDYDDWQRSAADAKTLSEKRAEAGKKGGKAKANGLANARAGDEANDTSSCQDVAQAEDKRGEERTSSSSVSDLQPPADRPEDDDGILGNLWKSWAHRKLHQRREAGQEEPYNVGGWLRSVADDLAGLYANDAKKLLAETPTATSDELLDRLTAPQLTVVPDGHQRHRTDWGATSDEVWDEQPDGTVRRRHA